MKARTFRGGYSFRGFAGQAQDVIVDLPAPPKAAIPLSQGFGRSLEPVAAAGDEVEAGQIIARDDEKICSAIHSSINGRVTAIEKKNYFKRQVTMVVIEGSGREGFRRLEGYNSNWEKLSCRDIERLLYESGVASLDREGIPTSFNTSIITPEKVKDLIIHGAGSEAYNISLGALLKGRSLFNFVEGIKILKSIMPQAKVYLALDKRRKDTIEIIKKLTTRIDNFQIAPVVSKYPQGYDEVLVPTILNKKFPYGYSAANIGIVVLNVQAVVQVFEAVGEGKPLIERIIALSGPGFKENIHVKARVGTPLEFILKDRLKDFPMRIILNSLITGHALSDLSLPVDRTFSELIAIPEETERKFMAFLRPGMGSDSASRAFASSFLPSKKKPETNLHGEERPCIQCGYCERVCPVKIMPSLLNRLAKPGINENLMKHGIFNCIDCNLCSYVCPCKIPLAGNLKDAKAKLIDSGCDQTLCILPKFNLIGLEDYKGVKTTR